MTNIAHCSRCGHKPNGLEDGRGVFDMRCGFGGGERMHWSDWQALVLADLAAQERELCAVPILQNWGNVDQPNMLPYPIAPSEARECVMRRYVWLGKNPLVLP